MNDRHYHPEDATSWLTGLHVAGIVLWSAR
ncbi:UNVERIFIED_CONTAM: hypothetical protein RKD43_005505 [Streptomyces graminofaciens]|jgi:hypothetical protein